MVKMWWPVRSQNSISNFHVIVIITLILFTRTARGKFPISFGTSNEFATIFSNKNIHMTIWTAQPYAVLNFGSWISLVKTKVELCVPQFFYMPRTGRCAFYSSIGLKKVFFYNWKFVPILLVHFAQKISAYGPCGAGRSVKKPFF